MSIVAVQSGRFLKRLIMAAATVAAIAVLIVGYVHGRQETAADEKQEQAPAAPSRVSVEAGQSVIALDAAAQAASGMQTKPLSATTQHRQLLENAIVLSVQSLTQLRTTYLSEVAQIDRAKAALEASQPEYERLKQLFEENQNVAAKTVQAAEATWHSDQVNLRAANEALQLNDILTRQTWGKAVAKWVSDGSPALDLVLAQKHLLLQVSFSLGGYAAPPRVSAQLPSGKIQSAGFVSAYPSVDPRIQTASFLYVTPATPELAPGMTLTVLVPVGSIARGVILPAGAIVWWQGKAWAYVQTAPERFARREVPTDMPVNNGWFVSGSFEPGEKVVIRGAQQLLSEEFRSQIQSLGEEGESEEKEQEKH